MRPFTTDIAAIPIEVNLAAESIGEHGLRITSIRKKALDWPLDEQRADAGTGDRVVVLHDHGLNSEP